MKFIKVIAHTVNVAALAGMIGVYAANNVAADTAQDTMSVADIVGAAELLCLQQNIYFEAGNQSLLGKVSVAWVTLNRVEDDRYPGTICVVVKQGLKDDKGNMIRHKCQFSWYCDGKADTVSDNVIEQRAWQDSQIVAEVVLLDWARAMQSPVGEAVMYHADYVEPYWASSYDRVVQIDTHIFYE